MINAKNMIVKRFPLFVCPLLLILLVMGGIPGAVATPTVSGISPGSGNYLSTVTIKITGTGFDSSNSVMLYRCPNKWGDFGVVYGTIKSWNANTITATFQLSGSQVVGGEYDVVVKSSTGPGYGLWSDGLGFTIKGGPTGGTTTATVATTTKTPTPTKTTTATSTTKTPTPTTATATTTQRGNNCVVFETNPSEAKISLSGSLIGTTPFTYCTDKDGTFTVVARKSGYEDYEDRVTIREGQRVRFYALLTPLTSATTVTTTAVTGSPAVDPTASATNDPVHTATTPRKSALKIPTPLGTDPPVAEESPADPALALAAAGIAIGLVLLRRR
jgi:hypothetical protein